MLKVGVTGGIGSGKTTFCKEWEKLGAFVLYADDLAKELMSTDEKLISQIKSVFGDGAYYQNGELNRAFLAEEAFAKGRVKELNEIVHPRLWKKVDEIAALKEKEGINVFVKEAAILLQHGRPDTVDKVVLLIANKSHRIERVIQRDKTKKELVEDRVGAQQDFEKLSSLADFIIHNDGSLKELKEKASELFYKIQK